MPASYLPTADTTPTRKSDRVSYDRAAVHAAIDEAVMCHLGFVVEGRPVVLPQLHARVGEHLYVHASSAARLMRSTREGIAVCVTISHIDGLVLARSAFNHSLNYRSVIVHGLAELVTDAEEKRKVLAAFVDAVLPGRADHVRGVNRKELGATAVLRIPLENVSLKSRSAPPGDDEEDLALPYWAGVIPLTNSVPGTPEPAPDLDPSMAVPAHVARWSLETRAS
jgi:nitroimidazol reductase NimA-like FMN-containing flavoprotein (pyridoxamine 5'-phosphate oxidase superfamily)